MAEIGLFEVLLPPEKAVGMRRADDFLSLVVECDPYENRLFLQITYITYIIS